MLHAALHGSNIDAFSLGNSLLKTLPQSKLGKSFEEVFEAKAKEVTEDVKEKSTEVTEEGKETKKKSKKNLNELPDITQIIKASDKRLSPELQKTYLLLDKFRRTIKSRKDDLSRGPRDQAMQNAFNAIGQPLIQQIQQRTGGRRMTRSQLLAKWQEYAPTVTENIMNKSIRLDIPLLKDVQALVLRMHPDRGITVSLLGSQEMGKLVKENKDKLDRNLRLHHLTLKEFNTYETEIALDSDSGTRRGKKKKQAKKENVDLI